MELYSVFEFRRREMRKRSPWWGRVLQENRRKATAIKARIRAEGALRCADFEDKSGRSDWGFSLTRRVLRCLWWAGDLAVRERKNFQPYYDLTERIIPDRARRHTMPERDALKTLLLKALDGHGWAQMGTLADTWRLTKRRKLLQACLCVRAGQAHGGQARAVFDDAGHDLPECELGLSPCSQGVNDVELLGEAQQNPDGSDAQALLKRNCLPLWVDQGDGGVVGSTKD